MKLFLKMIYHRQEISVRALFLTLLLLILLIPILFGSAGAQEQSTIIRLVPANASISPLDSVTTTVEIVNAVDLVVVEFHLRFDPTIVQAVDSADLSQLAFQVTLGSILTDRGTLIHRNSIFNDSGLIELETFLTTDAGTINGTGPLAFITWRGEDGGVSNLILEDVILTNVDGERVAANIVNGRIEILPDIATPEPTNTATLEPTQTATLEPAHTATVAPANTATVEPAHTVTVAPANTATQIPISTNTAVPAFAVTATISVQPFTSTPMQGQDPIPSSSIAGIILLQGRSVHAGTDIFLTEEPCSASVSGQATVTTDDNGFFEIPLSSNQAYQCLRAIHSGYLMGQQQLPQEDLGTVTLPGGDLNQDSVIDISDLNLIAANYHRADPIMDLNANGLVDIFDLSITSGNFGRKGPITPGQ